MIIPFEIKDYLAQARDMVTFAFEESPVFDKYLQLLTQPSLEIQEVLRQLMQERSIDTAVGAQLDIIGRIVGQDRTLIDSDLIPFFGYEGNPASNSYGDLSVGSSGGYYWDYNKPLSGNVTLSDEQYRLFIKAKILKNITRSTPDEVIEFIKFVFGAEVVNISYSQNAYAVILVSNDLNQFEKTLLQYVTTKGFRSYFIPKTIGVRYEFGEFNVDNHFSYAGVPSGNGYGSVGNPSVGGFYATLF